MTNYKTVEEKALEWGLTPRYIQGLCRQGKVEGAMKRAGSWFIPESTGYAGKTEKKNERYLIFSGTKRKIFDQAIDLFGRYSYEAVSIKDIADSVGIRQSAVYNHFSSKQVILDTIYAFFRHYLFASRPTVKDLEPVLRGGSLVDIINSVIYDFGPEEQASMISITKIVFQRVFYDEQARDIFCSLILDEGIRYCKEVFEHAVNIGRVAPFDTHLLSVFCNSTRLFTLWEIIVAPSSDTLNQFMRDEKALIEAASVHLKDLGKC